MIFRWLHMARARQHYQLACASSPGWSSLLPAPSLPSWAVLPPACQLLTPPPPPAYQLLTPAADAPFPPRSQSRKVIQNSEEILRMMAAATGEVMEKDIRDKFGDNPDVSKALRL